jgi:hypothetical protein
MIDQTLPKIQGEIADYVFHEGILISYSKPAKRTVESIQNNVTLVKKITGDKKVPLLIYLSKSPVPDKETRQYSAKMVPEIYTAMAMISKPGLANLVMKMVFGLKKSPVPIKLFTDDQKAMEWLKQFVEGNE